jgi:hypothetical protein
VITGHIGIALGLRAAARFDGSLPDRRWLLPALFVAAVLPDVLDVAMAQLEICSPFGLYSHSLPAIGALGAAAFLLAFIVTRDVRLAGLIGAAVLLHLPADFVTGEKLLWADGPLVGMRLYRSPVADFFIELPVVTGGWWLLRRKPSVRATHPRTTNWVTLVALIAFQAFMNVGTLSKPSACEAAVASRPWSVASAA